MARVLIACEFSGRIRDAFIKQGHIAMSCDLEPTERPGPHYQGDVFDIINDGWDLMIAHPPCTYLAISAAATNLRRKKEQAEALEFAWALIQAPIPRIAVENPVSVLSRLRKPTQIYNPYDFGEPQKKRTCLWLKNLPKLVPTKKVKPKYGTNHYLNYTQKKDRSRTQFGVANAMAEQWGALLKKEVS